MRLNHKTLIGMALIAFFTYFTPSVCLGAETLISETELLVPSDSGLPNAAKAASLVNGTVIQQGQIFSFNRVVGQRHVKRGFSLGPVITHRKGKAVKATGIGGGVCRTSTAIYQAARKANLKTVERHNHSLEVEYARQGDDAAVSWGTWDFQFQNNRSNPVRIAVQVVDNMIDVRIHEITPDQPVNILTSVEATGTLPPVVPSETGAVPLPEKQDKDISASRVSSAV